MANYTSLALTACQSHFYTITQWCTAITHSLIADVADTTILSNIHRSAERLSGLAACLVRLYNLSLHNRPTQYGSWLNYYEDTSIGLAVCCECYLNSTWHRSAANQHAVPNERRRRRDWTTCWWRSGRAYVVLLSIHQINRVNSQNVCDMNTPLNTLLQHLLLQVRYYQLWLA